MRYIFLFLIILGCASSGQRNPALSEPFAPPAAGSLFSSDSVLELSLKAPISSLAATAHESNFMASKTKMFAAEISYVGNDQKKIVIPVDLHVKGFTTMQTCLFPKMELHFHKKNVEGTLFQGLSAADLNTHCAEENNSSVMEAYRASYNNHREALVYKIANILEIPTYRARPVLMTYEDSDAPSSNLVVPGKKYQAFFLEDYGSFRARLHLKDIRHEKDFLKSFQGEKPDKKYIFTNVEDSPAIDREDLARVVLFHGLIANFDWYIKLDKNDKRFSGDDTSGLWNTKIVERPDGKWVIFPQDFSLSGWVIGNGSTYINNKALQLVDKASLEKIKGKFQDKKTELYQSIEVLSKDPKGYENAKKLLDSFYEALKQ
jgi:hypothetical protein